MAEDEYRRRIGLVLERLHCAQQAVERAKTFELAAYGGHSNPSLDTALAELVGATAELRQLRNAANARPDPPLVPDDHTPARRH